MGMTLPPDAREALVYRQGRGNLVARNLPLIFGYGLIGGGTVAFTAVMILDFQRDPSTPLAYFLLPVIVWGAFLEALLVSGAELYGRTPSLHRFAGHDFSRQGSLP